MKRTRKWKASDEASDEEDVQGVTQAGSVIFFHEGVNSASVRKLLGCLREANHAALTSHDKVVKIHIHSGGGDIFAGLTAYHHLITNPLPIFTYADGLVASAATLLLIAGKQRFAMPHSFCLIHQLTTGFFGKYQDMCDEMENAHAFMNTFRVIYKTKTKLSETELDKLLRSERVLNAKACLEFGLVHEIVAESFTSDDIPGKAIIPVPIEGNTGETN